MKLTVISPVISQKLVRITLFTDHCTENIFFTEESERFYSMDCIFSGSSRLTYVYSTRDHFLN